MWANMAGKSWNISIACAMGVAYLKVSAVLVGKQVAFGQGVGQRSVAPGKEFYRALKSIPVQVWFYKKG